MNIQININNGKLEDKNSTKKGIHGQNETFMVKYPKWATKSLRNKELNYRINTTVLFQYINSSYNNWKRSFQLRFEVTKVNPKPRNTNRLKHG